MDSAYSVPSDVLFDIHCKRQYSFRFSRESATLGLAISGASPPAGSDWQLRHQPTCNSVQSPYRVFCQIWQSWIAHDWTGAEPSR